VYIALYIALATFNPVRRTQTASCDDPFCVACIQQCRFAAAVLRRIDFFLGHIAILSA